MSTPRKLKDNSTDPHEWPQLLARLDGAVVPCHNQAPEWFSDNPRDQQRAASWCQACIAINACAAYALAADQPHGVWGGMTPAQRASILRERVA